MVMNRRRKENTGNGVSSFADLEDQHRQEAQRQVQSVSRSSNINTRQAEQNMNNLIQQQNQQANVLRQYVDSQANRAEEDRSRLKEYVQEGTEGLAENLTRSVDKRGSGARGDDLLSEIASGQTLQSLEQQDLANRAGEGIDEAGRYTKMGGQQLLRGSVNELNRIFNESEQGYMDWYQSSPENSYMQYAARNMNDPNADLTDINAGQEIQRQAQENFDRSRNWWRDALREKADSATDEELYQLFMAQNPTSNGDGFDPDKIRQNMRDTADLATDEWFTNVYNANENELSGTEAGQLLESVGSQVTRGTLAQLAGNALGGFGLDITKDPQAYMDAVNAMTGRSSLGMMGYGIAGSSTGEKIAEGYDPDRALAYGLTQAGIELGTEKMGDVLAPLAQKAGIDTSWLFNNVTAGQAMGLRENFGEGVEEFVGQMLDPFSEALLHPDMTAGDALQQAFSRENFSEALKAGAEGIASAALTGVATNPVQSAQMYAEDIQNLRNLPEQFDKDMTILANKINNTNEFDKAMKQNLVYDQEAQIDMMPEGAEKESAKQTLKETKENLWNQFGTKENLRSDDILVREAAEAANKDRILTQAREAGMSEDNAQRGAELANLIKETLQVKDRNTFVTEYGENNGVFDPVTGDITISSGTTDPFMVVIAHEAGGHAKEGSVEFRAFIDSVAEAIDSGKIKAVINGNEFRNTQSIENSIGRQYLDLFLDDQRKAEYASFFDNKGHVSDVRGLNDFLAREDIQQIVNSEAFQDMLDSERSAYLTQVALGSQQAVDYLKGRKARPFVDTLSSMMAALTNNEKKLRELDSKKTLHKALDLYKDALNEDITYEQSNAGINRMARDLTNNAVQNRQFSRNLDSEDSVENKIRNSMSMKEARRMLEKTWNQYKDYYDAKTLDEFIKDDPDYAVSQFAELIENTYGLQNEYINSNDDILNEEYMIEDVIQAYVDGNLKDESKSYKLKDTQYKEGQQQAETFFTPKTIKDAQKLYQVASQRVTKANEAEVYRARADLIVFAHNADAESTLGLTRSELNKKIRSWSRYSAQARQISERLNAGVPEQYRWSGLENSNNINQWLLANDTNIKNEISELVKEVKGDYDDNATRNIIDVMLALDSHINYKDLTLDFAYGKKIGQNGRANGTYDHLDTTITISSGARHTVAHETGHFVDNLWGREISEFMNEARNMYLSDLSLSSDFVTGNEDLDTFISNFRTFIDKLAAKNDIRNEYTQTRTEIFARFCDYFVGWVNTTAGGYDSSYRAYNDNFTPADCSDFVKLLQQKSMLNATVLADTKTTKQNLKFSKDLDAEYREDGTRKDLIAAHNLTQDKLRKVKNLGGSVMPSIAVTKDTIPHKGYGDITIVMDKRSVDPARRDNKAYKRDAWTPRFPEVNYRATFDSLYDLNEELSSIPYYEELTKSSINSDMYRLKDADNFQNLLESNNGDPVKAFEKNDAMKALYLLDKGQISSLPVREKEITGEFHNTDAKEIASKIGTWNIEQIDKASVEEARQYLGDVLKTINKHFSDKLGYEGDLYNEANFSVYDLKDFARAINSYIEDNTKFQEIDRSKLSTVAVEADDVDYRNWLKDKFKSLKIESGIRNNKDPFTPSGKRRSFKELHDPLTAERALKHMKAQDPAGSDTFFSPTFNAIIGVYNGEYRNLNDFIKNEGILAPDSDDKSSLYYQLEQEYTDSINTLASEAFDNSTSKYKQYYSYQGLVADAVAEFAKSKNHTPENLKRILKSDGNIVSDEAAQAMVDVLERTKDITTDYYEVKAQRIVRPDEEWKQAYYPTGTDADLVQWMQDQGMETYEYDPKVSDARWTKINENAGKYKFSRQLDSDGKKLSKGQQEFFKDSEARNEDGSLLTLYHGTPSAGFTTFKDGWVWMTTSREDADSYAGNWEHKIFDPNEQPVRFNTSGEVWPIGDHMRFDTEQDRNDFLKKFPDAENYITEKEYRWALDEAADYDDYEKRERKLTKQRQKSEKMETAYRKYEWSHSGMYTIGEIIDNPSRFSLQDLKDAWIAWDREAAVNDYDDEFDSEEEYRDWLAESLRNTLEETDNEHVRDMEVSVRVPAGEVGEVYRGTERRTYKMYANLTHPYIFDHNGQMDGFDGYYQKIQDAMNDPQYDGVIARNARTGRYKLPGTVVIAKSAEQVKLTSNKNPTLNKDTRFSRDLLDDDNLAEVNPFLVSEGASLVDRRLTASERQIDRSKIPASVLDKAYTYEDFGKKFEKKNKTVSDMAWLGRKLQEAQEEVNRENADYRGREAFGGAYGEVIRRLKEAGVQEPKDVVNQYLDNITWKGTQKADAMIENDPNASVIMSAIKTNLNPKYIQNLQDAHFASQRKAQKTRDESKVKGTEAYYRKSLEKGRSYVKERTSELLKGLGADIDLRMSPMMASRYFGGGVIHSPIGDARAALRESGITKTSEYSDWLKLYFLESLEGYKHNDEMLSRLKDKILSDEQLASDSDMANGGFEYMLEQLENAAKRYLRLKTEMEDPDYNNDRYMSDLYQVGTVVPLTENDHMSTATRDLRLAGALGTTANDPRLAQVAEKVESILRDRSADESETFRSYGRFDPNDKFGMNNPYMDRIYKETGIRDEWIIDQIYHDMKLAHGRNNQRPYIPAPTQSEINLATAKRRAESAAKTREFFNNRDSLNEAVEEASANEAPEETIPVEDIPVNEEQVNTSAYGAENYMFPGDLDDPRRFQQFDFDSDDINPNNNTGLNEPFSYEDMYARAFYGDDYQTQPDDYQLPTDADAPAEVKRSPLDVGNVALRNEYDEATRDIDKGMNFISPADYTPGKLESERSDDDRSESRKKAAEMREDIDTITSVGQNLGSTSKTIQQNNDQIAKDNAEVRDALKKVIEDPFYEAKKKMFQHYKEMVKKLSYVTDKLGIKAGSEESKALQWFMENSKDTNAENQSEVMYTLENLKEDFPDKWQKIQEAAKILEDMYDEYYTKINEAMEMIYPEKAILEEAARQRKMIDDQLREKQARLEQLLQDPYATRDEIKEYRRQIRQLSKKYNEVDRDVRLQKRLPLRQHYVHHFQDVKPTLKNIWAAMKDVADNTGSNNISNQLADISEWTQPNARWWGSMMQRNNGEYTADAIGGMLRYMDRAEQKIFIDPYTAYMRGVIREFKNSADENKTDMSTMIRYYSAWVNDLAGKTNPYDRMLTYAFNGKGRQVITVMKLLNSRVKSNAVMGNINSAIAQFYNLPNAIAILREKGGSQAMEDWRKGLSQYMVDKANNNLDSLVSQSVFLNERFFDDVTSPLMDLSSPQKFTMAMMQFGDKAIAEMTWYAAYEQGKRLNVANPVQYADEMTARSVAGRGIGEVPITQKSELTKLLAPFQVEVNNQWQVLKHLVGERQGAALLGMFLSAFFMNILKKKVTGTEGTGLDPIAAIVDAFKDNEGFSDTLSAIGMNLTGEVISNMPFGALMAEFMGMASDGYASYFGDHDPTRYGVGNIGMAGLMKPLLQVLSGDADKVDWTKLATNYGVPYGGRQLERTVKTMQDMGYLPHFGQGNYGWKEGAYTSSGKLKYMIDKDSPVDVIRSLLFGTYASEGGQEYLENRKALGESSVAVMDSLIDMGADSYDTWQAMRSLSSVEYPAGVTNAKGLATRKALEDAGLWDEWSEAYESAEDQDAFRSGTNGIGKKVAAMDEDEFQRAYDEIFGEGSEEAVNVPAEAESVPAVTESASMSPSRQQAYDTVTSADIGVDSDRLSQTMSSLATQNLTDADGNKIDNSRSAVNRLSYEEDGSYQAIIDFIESDDNKNSDDPLTYADFGLSKSVVNMDDEELEELLEQINEGTGSTYRRRSGGSSRGNSRRANAFRRSGTSAIRSLGNQHISTYVPKKKGSYTRSTDTIKRLQQKTKSLTNGVMKTDVDLYDSIFNK